MRKGICLATLVLSLALGCKQDMAKDRICEGVVGIEISVYNNQQTVISSGRDKQLTFTKTQYSTDLDVISGKRKISIREGEFIRGDLGHIFYITNNGDKATLFYAP